MPDCPEKLIQSRVAIVGGGAAGCFCAIELKRLRPDIGVTVYEAGRVPLAKVAVTGGGRCNLTNTFEDIGSLRDAYPRGGRLMKRLLADFGWKETMAWFEKEGVRLTVQPDRCVFPVSQDAMQIVRTLENLMRRLGVELRCGCRVDHLKFSENDAAPVSAGNALPSSAPWSLTFSDGSISRADAVVVTTGGSTLAGLERMFAGLDLTIEPTVPSLFTFKIPDDGLHRLMGTVVEDVLLSLAGTTFRSRGALLLTDWGVSGPATLKLSSYAARHLAENGYRSTLSVNWLASSEADVRRIISDVSSSSPSRFVANSPLPGLTDRLWKHLVQRSSLRPECRWAELGSKGINKLVSVLTSDIYPIEGRARFKEEFVTCGGVSLSNISLNTLECRRHPGLYFAGEVLDVDAITGGFNLQAAWSTGFRVAGSLASI